MAKEAVWANVNDIAIRFTAERYAKFENIAIRESSICVANSRATRADFESRYNPPPNWDCEVVHWGVDTEMFRPLDIENEQENRNFTEIRTRFGAVSPGSKLLLAVGRSGKEGLWYSDSRVFGIEQGDAKHQACNSR